MRQQTGFKAAESNAWVYVGRVSSDTVAEDVVKYIKEKTNEEKIICEDLKIIGRNKAFKVGINMNFKEQLYDPGFWPTGTLVRRFDFFRDRQQQ